MEKTPAFCPMCQNHCPSGDEKCERGKAYFQNGGEAEPGRHHDYDHGHGPHHGAHRHHHFENDIPKDSLTGLFMECGHHLFHGLHRGVNSEAELFECLSDSEKATLKETLAKLLAAWQKHP